MTVANLYPNINPSLLLDFVNVKALDPRITFVRDSGASYHDNLGVLRSATNNQARFDHDPLTGESLGLLIEEQRTNLVLRSEQFDDAYWTKTNSSITLNLAVAPNSTLTADKLVENTSTGNHIVFVGGVSSAATTFTASVYAKASERDRLRLQARNERSPSGGANADFNLATQTVVIGNFGDGTGVGRIESVGQGWFRCSITVTVVTAGTTLVFAVFLANAAGSVNYTGDGTSGILLWGAQLEAGAFPTSYIRTEASQVTRLADAASITGTNFSSWYRADEGSFYTEANSAGSLMVNPVVYSVSDGSFNNTNYVVLAGGVGSNRTQSIVRSAGSDSAGMEPTATYVNFAYTNVITTYQLNNFAVSADGATAVVDSLGPVPVGVNRMTLGSMIGASNNFINGSIKKIAYYPQRLTNTQLQALTR